VEITFGITSRKWTLSRQTVRKQGDWKGHEFFSCRIGPARVERTLLSAAFDPDLDFAGCTHGPLQDRGGAALQQALCKRSKGEASSVMIAPAKMGQPPATANKHP